MVITTFRVVHFILLVSIVSCRTVKNAHPRAESVFNSETTKNQILPVVPKAIPQSRLVDTRSFDSDEPESNESQATKAPSYRLDLGSTNSLDKDADASNQILTAEDSSQDTTPGTQSDDGDTENTTPPVQDDSSADSDETQNHDKEQEEHQQESQQESDEVSPEDDSEHQPVEIHNISKTDLTATSTNAEDTTFKKECIEGDVIRVDCNTCVCSSGNYFCSKKVCDSKYAMRPENKKHHGPEPMVIEVNHTASFDKDVSSIFNVIRVSSTTTTTTTTTTTPIPDCVDGRTKPVDCNQCICALGKWACTKMACIALTLREKASFTGSDFIERVGTLKENANMDDDCFEGETKPMGCNQCVCHQNSWACTDMKCLSTTVSTIANELEETCQTEEDVKSKECNICACRRGVWVCTKNDCKKFGNKYYHPSIRTSTTPTDTLDN